MQINPDKRAPLTFTERILKVLEGIPHSKSFENQLPPEGIPMDLVPTLKLNPDAKVSGEHSHEKPHATAAEHSAAHPAPQHPAHHTEHHTRPAHKLPTSHLAHVSITPTVAGSYLLTGMCIADSASPALVGKWINSAPMLLEQFPERLTMPPSVIDTMGACYRVDSWAVNPIDVLNAIRLKDAKRTVKHKVTLEIEVPFDHDEASWTSEAGGVLMVQDLLVSPALADSLNKVVSVYNTPNIPKDEQWRYIKQQEAKQALVKSIVIQHHSTERVQS